MYTLFSPRQILVYGGSSSILIESLIFHGLQEMEFDKQAGVVATSASWKY